MKEPRDIPCIGITTNTTDISINMSASQTVNLVQNVYPNLVTEYNCIPVLISNNVNLEHIEHLVGKLSGVLLTSGPDLDPSTYNDANKVNYSVSVSFVGEPYKRNIKVSPDLKRDHLELSLYKSAKDKGIPILGICRGMQLINVAEGGTLHPELPESSINHFIEKDGWINYHEITISKNTLCHDILGIEKTFVSSIHHQGIKDIGKNLMCSAIAEDGVVEIIEYKNASKFIFGVQSHLEMTRKANPILENIFKAFFQKVKDFNQMS